MRKSKKNKQVHKFNMLHHQTYDERSSEKSTKLSHCWFPAFSVSRCCKNWWWTYTRKFPTMSTWVHVIKGNFLSQLFITTSRKNSLTPSRRETKKQKDSCSQPKQFGIKVILLFCYYCCSANVNSTPCNYPVKLQDKKTQRKCSTTRYMYSEEYT